MSRQAFVDQLLAEKRALERCLSAVDAALHIYTLVLEQTARCLVHPEPPEPESPPEPAPEPPPAPPIEPPGETAPLDLPRAAPSRDGVLLNPPPLSNVPLAPDNRIFTPERNRIIKEEWPNNTPGPEIAAMLNALPGRHVPIERVAIQANKMGLRRRLAAPPPPPAPEPKPNRLEVMRQVAASIAKPREPALIGMPGEPIAVDFEQTRRWAGVRGIAFLTWDDLPKVNKKREALGQAPFKRLFGPRGNGQ